MKINTNRAATAAAALCAVLTAAAAIALLFFGKNSMAYVFFVLSAMQLAAAAMLTYWSMAVFDAAGARFLANAPRRPACRWEDCREALVIGICRRGALWSARVRTYICLSADELTDCQRYNIHAGWPPKDEIFVPYSPQALEYIRLWHSGRIEYYNCCTGGHLS